MPLYLGAGGVVTTAGVAAFLGAESSARLGAAMLVLLGAVSLYLAFGSCRRIGASGGALTVRGFGKSRSLELDACARGHR